ncbi:uncharacterized protein EV420DRAFT_1278600, partial [Desarmillaria tabescens]
PRHRGQDEARHREAFRRDVLGLPSAINVWLFAQLEGNATAPQVLTTNASVFGDVLNIDYVECSVRSIWQPGAIYRPFHEPSIYSLTLAVHLPTPTSVRLLPHITSPPIILDTYTGEDYEIEAPDWVSHLDSTLRHFWQPHAHIVELVASLSLTADNVHGARHLVRWCTALSVCSLPHFILFYLLIYY